jgi:uncharacterized delta-60 repeat protein
MFERFIQALHRPFVKGRGPHPLPKVAGRRARRRLAVEVLEQRALLAAGDLDWSFNKTGTAAVAFDRGLSNADTAADSAVDSLGRTVIVGTVQIERAGDTEFGIARLLPDGTPDLTFGSKGRTIVSFDQRHFLDDLVDTVAAVAIQSDGKILVAGTHGGSGVSDNFALVRLNTNGTLDTPFGTTNDGRVEFGFDLGGSNNDRITDIAIQPDGKIVLVGVTTKNNQADTDFAMARLNSNGTLDTTFNEDGKTWVDFGQGNSSDSAEAVVIQPNGAIVFAGTASNANGYTDYAVTRFDSTGHFDTTFDGDGMARYGTNLFPFASCHAFDAALQSDGKIVLGGKLVEFDLSLPALYDHLSALRLNSNGTVDTTFGTNGEFIYANNHSIQSVANDVLIQPDGKIVLGGAASNQFTIVRVLASGQLDLSFNGRGTQVVSGSSIQSLNYLDGKIYAAGTTSQYGDDDFAVVRLQAIPPASTIVGRAGGQWYAAVGSGNTFQTRATVGWSDVAYVDVQAADVNGDGLDDLIGRETATGIWWVSLNVGNGAYITQQNFAVWSPSVAWQNVRVGDFNGDGRADVAGRSGTTGMWQLGISNGNKFNTIAQGATWSTTGTWVDVFAADLTGDGIDDIIGRDAKTGAWNVLRSTGSLLINSVWKTWSTAAWSATQVGDVNGDGKADVVSRGTNGLIYVALSTGTALGNAAAWTTSAVPAGTWTDVKLADMTNDGKQDLIARIGSVWYVAVSNGARFVTVQWGTWPAGTYVDVVVGDFNGDGRLDLAGRSAGKWYVLRNQNGNTFTAAALWGTWSTSLVWKDVQTGRGLI